jgi:hypothetical protein
MRTHDDGQRGPVAVCLSLRRTGDDIEVTMDDLVRRTDQEASRTHWDHDRFITFATITAEQLNGKMSERDYARFGRFVFGSISALAKFRLPSNT